ncbi:MAG: hypothetical protein QW617_03635 [Acidilobaceae archaeon]
MKYLSFSNCRKLLVSEPDFAARLYLIAPSDLSEVMISKLLELGAVEVSTVKKSDLLRSESPLALKLEKYFRLIEEAELLVSKFAEHLEKNAEVEIVEVDDPLRALEVLERLLLKLKEALAKLEFISKAENDLKRRLLELRLLKNLVESLQKEYRRGDTSLLEYRGELYNVISFYGSPEVIEKLASESLTVLAKVEVDGVTAVSLLLPAKARETPQGASEIRVIREAPRASLEELAGWVEFEIKRVEVELRKLFTTKKEILEEHLRDYSLLVALLEAESSRAKVIKQALSSPFFTVVSGLVPSSFCPEVGEAFRGVPVYSFCEPEEDPPAELKNLRPFKPFEQLTKLLGAPSLTDWDPTPLLAYAFTTLFGLMVGDVGYGLLFLVLAIASPSLASKLGLETEIAERLRSLIIVCGLSSIVAGLLFGSFFGDLLQKLLGLQIPKAIDPLNELSRLMLYSIVLGWVWLLLSYCLGLARAVFKLKSLTSAVSSLSMIALLVSGPHVVAVFFFNRPIFPSQLEPLVYALIGLGVLGLVVSKVATMGSVGLFLWVFGISGLATEVLSFLRVAALAFGTSLLAGLANEAALVAASLFVPLGAILFVVGHAFSFTLTSIAALAHTIRLCAYEISMKFYSGSNRFLEYTRYRVPRKVFLEAKRRQLRER